MVRKRAYAPLDVYMNRRKVGQYFREPDGAFAFTYAAKWLVWENTLPILDLHRFCSGQVLMLGGLLFEGDG